MEAGYLTNFIPNISTLNSKQFTNYQLKNRPPLLGKLGDYTILNDWLKHFFQP